MPLDQQSDLFDVTLVVTVRAYDDDDAWHLARLYHDRVSGLAPAWPVQLVAVESSGRTAI